MSDPANAPPPLERGDDHVRSHKLGRLVVLTLDRPRALNALDVGMVRALLALVQTFADDDGVDAIVLRSSSERAFCAGGDMRAIGTLPTPEARMALGSDFFTTEYRLNLFMQRCPKPIVSLIDGIAMGGGIGLSVFGSHRVVSERVRLAMPEVALGFFPDVGGAYFLNRCPGAIGRYLALTGTSIGAADAIYSGLATHHVPAERFESLLEALSNAALRTPEAVDAVLRRFEADAGLSELAERRQLIDNIFAAESLTEVTSRLAEVAVPTPAWLSDAAQAIAKGSPTSLRATWRRMTAAKTADLQHVLDEDLRLAVRLVARDDFVEGVRAILVDKDQKPRWRPATIDAVDERAIDDLLAPTATGALLGV